MERSLKSHNWNSWDALIVLASVVLFREITSWALGLLAAELPVGPTLLIEYLGASLGLFLVHGYIQHTYYRATLKINLSIEKPLWYLQIAFVAGLLMFMVLTLGYNQLLYGLGIRLPSHLLHYMEVENVFDRATLFLALCLFYPMISEIVYRGYLYQAFEKRFGNGFSMLLTSLLFAFSYLDLWAVPPLFVAGIVLVLVYEMTSSLYTSIFSMVIWQALTLAYLLFL